ncbi:transglycosylase domain-containing protein [Lihuaxuella thermophila]|uniref:Penicillin-binding protein n=1 Tax=Lihuaxuella thermophila TaxID=1173111 RepID=A0A1H8AHF2_9BACL|nr:transglycosylase domain-containing protein [Lihuaxuella thermophila]SEM69973.1 penicillin-binding protein [Lihuaxuella thermophila]
MKFGNTQFDKKKIIKQITRILFVCLVMVLVVAVGAVGVGAGVVSAFAKDEKLRTKEDYEKELSNWSQTSYAYFRSPDGKSTPKKIGSLVTSDDRQLIRSLDQVSPYLIDAFLSVEDREFYNHNGIVPRSILRAAYQQITGSEVTTGGSTITQQLVKNEILGNREKSYERKALEILNSIRIEKYYDKDEIFVAYLNSVYFGKGAHGKHMYGVAAAARGIFNKPVKQLELAQAAYIAGMVQRPNDYNPVDPTRGEENREENLKRGLKRMKLVLEQMLKNQKITQEQYEQALRVNIKGSLAKPDDFTNGYEKYPFIISAVEREVIEILRERDKGNPEAKNKTYLDYRKEATQGGFHIYTTIDEQLYNAMNQSVQNLYFPKKKLKGKRRQEQIGAVLIDNKTGAVLSFYSGVDFKQNEVDHAFVAKNQPGSAIKPLLVYGPAINEGIVSPDSTIIDEPLAKADGSGVYKNANGKYKNGPVDATYALKWSLNIPAIKIFRQLGIERGFNYLKEMGIEPHENDLVEAAALGGFTYGPTVEQMTAAYAMLGNQGVYNKPHLIEKITDSYGNVIYDYHKQHQPKQVFKAQTAYQLTQMLRQVVTSGTAAERIGNRIGSYNVAGKTGTTSNEWDLWFVGYTPEVSLGVWSGYDYNTKGSKNLAKDAWVKLFKAAASTRPDLIPQGSQFANPGGSIESKCFECNRIPQNPSPGTQNPGNQNPGNQNPWNPNPGQNPGTQNPGVSNPGTQNPGTTDPGTQNPGTSDPGTQDPGTPDNPENPDTGTQDPGTQNP